MSSCRATNAEAKPAIGVFVRPIYKLPYSETRIFKAYRLLFTLRPGCVFSNAKYLDQASTRARCKQRARRGHCQRQDDRAQGRAIKQPQRPEEEAESDGEGEVLATLRRGRWWRAAGAVCVAGSPWIKRCRSWSDMCGFCSMSCTLSDLVLAVNPVADENNFCSVKFSI